MNMQITEIELNSQSAGRYAFFAARDAAFKSAVNASRFSNQLKLKAERMKLVLEMIYAGDGVSITYCKKWARVKVHNARPRDRKLIKEWEDNWAQDSIVKAVTDQGIIYRVAE
jgi:hypothetical protein